MINVTILAVGGLKERYLRDGCAEYCKRLGAYCKLTVVEIEEEKLPENPSAAQVEHGMTREGERILKRLPKGAVVLPLCIEGQEYSSPAFSALLDKLAFEASHLCFVIGGSYGLSEAVKALGKTKLSFGKLTLPHQLARLVLLEQIYRAFSISNHTKYHK